jgi:putative phage-type endonuclease
MPRLTETQQRERTSYLGASDIAVLAGVSPYKKPFELYLEKIGELDPIARSTQDDRDRWERGHRLEDVALEWDAEIRGHSFERIRRDIVHPRLPFVVVHPDARQKPWRSTKRLLEAKTSARKWDEVPQHVEAQVQAQMAAAGADVADVVLLGFDGPPKPYEVPRNDELIGELEGLAVAFWDRVAKREPPPLDDSRAASRYLDRLFREGPEIEADADQSRALARLLEIRSVVERLESEDRSIVNTLKFSMAGSSRLYAPGVGKVVWTAPGERRTVAWKELAAAYRAVLQHVVDRLPGVFSELDSGIPDPDALESLYERIETGVRQFRVTPAKTRQEAA